MWIRWTPVRVACSYMALGAIWILASDYLWKGSGYFVNSGKGLTFVAVTGLALYSLMNRLVNQLAAEKQNIHLALERLQIVIESAPFGIFIQANQRFQSVNKAAMRMFAAATPEQLLGQPILDRVHPSFHQQIRERMATLKEQKLPVSSVHEILLTLDGHRFHAEVSAVPFQHEGQPAALVYVSDISERINREQLYRDLAEAIPATVWVAAGDGRILYLNNRWYEYTGQSRQASLESWVDAVHPDDRESAMAAWQAALDTLAPYEFRLRYRRFDGEYRWHLARALAVGVSEGTAANWVGIGSDVDEPTRFIRFLEKAAEQERLRISRELHDDLGQLLVAAKLHLELALRRPENLELHLNTATEQLVAAIQHIKSMAMMLRPGNLDQAGLLPALQLEARHFKATTGVDCEVVSNVVSIPYQYSAALVAYRIIREALTNAAKHARATSVKITVTYNNGLLRATVADNGCGFIDSQEIRSRGLGLISMNERASSAGGRLAIHSSAAGTEVHLELPLLVEPVCQL